MRQIFFITLSVFCVLSFAYADEYSADMEQQMAGQTFTGKIFVKDSMRRVDMDMRGMKQSTIMNLETGKAFLLNHPMKMVMDVPHIDPGMKLTESEDDLNKYGKRSKVGTETVNGIDCNKYEFVYHDQSLGKAWQWLSKKNNRPVKLHYKSPEGEEMLMTYSNFQNGGVSESVFEVPGGYQRMDLGALQNMMGG